MLSFEFSKCSNGALAGSTAGPTTPINLSITYAAEVNGTLTADVLSDLEATLLEAAIAAALGCNSTGRRALSGAASRRRKLAVTSESLGESKSDALVCLSGGLMLLVCYHYR